MISGEHPSGAVRGVLEVLFVAGVGGLAIGGFGLVLAAAGWALSRNFGDRPWREVMTYNPSAALSLLWWGFRRRALQLFLASLAVAVVSGTTMLVIWGE